MAVMNAGDVLWSWYLHGMAEGGKWSKTPTTTLISQPVTQTDERTLQCVWIIYKQNVPLPRNSNALLLDVLLCYTCMKINFLQQTSVSFLSSYLVHLANKIIQSWIIHGYMWFLPGLCSLGLGRFVTQVWGHIKTLAGWREPSRNFFLVSGKCIPPRGVCK